MREQGLEQLIGNLTEQLAPVRPLAHPLKRGLAWMAFALAYMGLAVWISGVRPDIADKLTDQPYLLETALGAAMALFAALSSMWLCIPDLRGQRGLSVVAYTLFAVFLGWTLLRVLTEGMHAHDLHANHCFAEGLLYGFFPMLALVILSRKGATTHPFQQSFMNGLAVMGLGYVGLRFTCALDNVEHCTLFHFMPYVLLGGVLGLFARKIYKW